jgi:hypothetical protein
VLLESPPPSKSGGTALGLCAGGTRAAGVVSTLATAVACRMVSMVATNRWADSVGSGLGPAPPVPAPGPEPTGAHSDTKAARMGFRLREAPVFRKP